MTSILGLRASIWASHEPAGAPRRSACLTTALAPMVSSRRRVRSPIREIDPSLGLPPVDFCRGVSPIQAEKCRPALKVCGDGVGTIAVAMTEPTPEMVHQPAGGEQVDLSSARDLHVEHADLFVQSAPGWRPAHAGPTWRSPARRCRGPRCARSAGPRAGTLGDAQPYSAQVAAKSVDRLCPLAYREIARPEHHAAGLLLFVLHRREAHARPLRRLADRLGVGRVVLLPLDERLDVGRRDQPRPVCPSRASSRPQ